MSLYENQKCPVCGVAFKSGDDIVTCPECGTPRPAQEGFHCAKCGYTSPKSGMRFCPECGAPAENGQ